MNENVSLIAQQSCRQSCGFTNFKKIHVNSCWKKRDNGDTVCSKSYGGLTSAKVEPAFRVLCTRTTNRCELATNLKADSDTASIHQTASKAESTLLTFDEHCEWNEDESGVNTLLHATWLNYWPCTNQPLQLPTSTIL